MVKGMLGCVLYMKMLQHQGELCPGRALCQHQQPWAALGAPLPRAGVGGTGAAPTGATLWWSRVRAAGTGIRSREGFVVSWVRSPSLYRTSTTEPIFTSRK